MTIDEIGKILNDYELRKWLWEEGEGGREFYEKLYHWLKKIHFSLG